MNAKKTVSDTPDAPVVYACPDNPDAFLTLCAAEQEALLAYLKAKFKPGKAAYNKNSSYGLKHVFEESVGGFYVSNGQFKGAMLRAGFKPTNPSGQNWFFKIEAAQGCAGRLKSVPFGSTPCYKKADAVTGLCPYHAERKRWGQSIDATVYPDRESWLAAMDARRGVRGTRA